MPATMIHGVVCSHLSASSPNTVNPIVGTNIRHVVSPIVPSNKMTVDLSGGVGFLSPSFCDALMYLYTISVEEAFAKMPRRNNTPVHKPFLFTPSCSQKRRFLKEREALDAAEHQMLIKPNLELSVYKCEHCGGWHLTRQTRK